MSAKTMECNLDSNTGNANKVSLDPEFSKLFLIIQIGLFPRSVLNSFKFIPAFRRSMVEIENRKASRAWFLVK